MVFHGFEIVEVCRHHVCGLLLYAAAGFYSMLPGYVAASIIHFACCHEILALKQTPTDTRPALDLVDEIKLDGLDDDSEAGAVSSGCCMSNHSCRIRASPRKQTPQVLRG